MTTKATPTTMTAEELQLKIDTMQHGDRFATDNMGRSRDPRTGRFNGPNDDDTSAVVEFKTEAVYSPRETAIADGLPKYVDMDFISIRLPGDRGKEISVWSQVTDFYINRFPHEHQAFKTGKSQAVTGTPLSLWPQMNPSSIKELEHIGVRTLEQLASLSDSNSATMRNFHALKNGARVFLESSRELASSAVMQAKLDDQAAAHQSQIDALNAKFEALMSGKTPDLAAALKSKKKVAEPDEAEIDK